MAIERFGFAYGGTEKESSGYIYITDVGPIFLPGDWQEYPDFSKRKESGVTVIARIGGEDFTKKSKFSYSRAKELEAWWSHR